MKKAALSLAFLAAGSAGFVLAEDIAQHGREKPALSPEDTVLAANSEDVNIGSGKSIGSDRHNKDDGSGNIVIRGRDEADAQGDCTPGTAGREGRVTRGKDNAIGDSKSSGKNSGQVTIRAGKAGQPGRCDDADFGNENDPKNNDDNEEDPEDSSSDK